MLYSPSTNGFYLIEIHGNSIPNDCIEISDTEYKNLINEQLNGYSITSDENGFPKLIKYHNIANETQNAKTYLIQTDWYYIRKLETGEEIPPEIIIKRNEARELIRVNKVIAP